MDRQLFNDYIVKLLKNKAMLSIDIINDLLIRFPDINKNTIKSMILRSKLLRSSKPKTFAYNSYAYTLKTNRNYAVLFDRLEENNVSAIKYLSGILSRRGAFLSIFTFKKILDIKDKNDALVKKKIEILKHYKNAISFNNGIICPYSENAYINTNTNFYNKQRMRLLAAKILLYKHNSMNLIMIKRSNYLSIRGNELLYPKPLYNIYFDAYSQAVSYINKDNVRSYVVYDFAIEEEYSETECKSFINRVFRLRKYGLFVIPICVYKKISIKAKLLIKSHGIIGISHSSFLGKEGDDLLNDIININNDEVGNCSSEMVDNIITSVDKIGIFEQTKGYLFEYICYRILKTYYGDSVKRNVVCKGSGGNKAQFDIVVYLSTETIVAECKATTANIGFGTIKNGIINTIAHTIKKIELLPNNNKKSMLYFTTSHYKKINDDNNKILKQYYPLNNIANDCCLLDYETLLNQNIDDNWLRLWEKWFVNQK